MPTPTLQPRTKAVTIYQGDFGDDIEQLRKKVDAAKDAERDAPPRRMGDLLESQLLTEQHNALVVEAEASAIVVKVRNLGRRAYHDLKVKHPPRDGDEADETIGCNQDTFFDELVPLSLVAPSFDSETDQERFFEDLPAIDWERIKLAAFQVNEVAQADPKLLSVSKPDTANDAT